jgi:ornithine lipid ester-linked acyl 2-hydroxylase
MFEFSKILEKNFETIEKEIKNLIYDEDFIKWPENISNIGWKVFGNNKINLKGLIAFGREIDKNIQKCPETKKILKNIPNLTTAGFSSLEPNTHITLHKGFFFYIKLIYKKKVIKDIVIKF